MTLITLLEWWNLIYVVPFGLALMYLGVFVFTGITFGDAEVDGDVDADAGLSADGPVHVEGHVVDTDADFGADAHGEVHSGGEHDADDGDHAETSGLTHTHVHGGGGHRGSAATDFLSFLGLGKIPASLALMILLMFWGVIGFGLNAMLAQWIGVSSLVGVITLPITVIMSVLLTGACAALIAKIIPVADSKGQRREDLVGRTGDAIFDIDSSFGMASVRTATGDLMQVPCQTGDGAARIPKGSRVVIFNYDREKGVFRVAPFAA